MGRINWGHTYITKYGNCVTVYTPHALEYHYEASDGGGFQKLGSERYIHLEILPETTIGDLKVILQEDLKMDAQVRAVLEEVVQKGLMVREAVFWDKEQ